MLRILLINDTAKKVGRLKSALSEAGFEVVDESGLTIDLPARVAAVRPDVILIDSESPGRDVMEQVCLLSRDQPHPIVMFTDEHDPGVMRQAIQSGSAPTSSRASTPSACSRSSTWPWPASRATRPCAPSSTPATSRWPSASASSWPRAC